MGLLNWHIKDWQCLLGQLPPSPSVGGFGVGEADENYSRVPSPSPATPWCSHCWEELRQRCRIIARGSNPWFVLEMALSLETSLITFYLLNLILSPAGCFPSLNHCKSNCLEIPSIDSWFLFISFLLFGTSKGPETEQDHSELFRLPPWRQRPDVYLLLLLLFRASQHCDYPHAVCQSASHLFSSFLEADRWLVLLNTILVLKTALF